MNGVLRETDEGHWEGRAGEAMKRSRHLNSQFKVKFKIPS